MATATGAAGIISDDFYEGGGAKSPDPGWSFNTYGDANCTQAWEGTGTTDALLVLTIDEAANHYSDVGTWDAPTFWQSAATTDDFTIEAKIQTLDFAANYDGGGIVVQHAAGYIICETYRDGTNQVMNFQRTGQAAQTANITLNTIPIWLQIRRSGTTWSGWYSTNGSGFTQIGTNQTLTATPTNVGCYGANDSVATADTVVKFDYFFENSARITAEDQAPGATSRIMVIT